MGTIRRPGAAPYLMLTRCVIIGSIFVPIFDCGVLVSHLTSYPLSHCLTQQLLDLKFRGAEHLSHAMSGYCQKIQYRYLNRRCFCSIVQVQPGKYSLHYG